MRVSILSSTLESQGKYTGPFLNLNAHTLCDRRGPEVSVVERHDLVDVHALVVAHGATRKEHCDLRLLRRLSRHTVGLAAHTFPASEWRIVVSLPSLD